MLVASGRLRGHLDLTQRGALPLGFQRMLQVFTRWAPWMWRCCCLWQRTRYLPICVQYSMALGIWTQLSLLSRVGFDNSDDIRHTDQRTWIVSIVSKTTLLLGPLDMGPYIFFSIPHSRSDFPVTQRKLVGSDLDFLLCVWWLAQDKVAIDLCRESFVWTFVAPINSSAPLIWENGIRAILSGGGGERVRRGWRNVFCSARQKKKRRSNVGSALLPTIMDTSFGNALCLPYLELRRSRKFAYLKKQDRTKWPRCMLWHGWLPDLTARPTGSPWAVAAGDLASHDLEKSLGYPLCTDSPWWCVLDARDMSLQVQAFWRCQPGSDTGSQCCPWNWMHARSVPGQTRRTLESRNDKDANTHDNSSVFFFFFFEL